MLFLLFLPACSSRVIYKNANSSEMDEVSSISSVPETNHFTDTCISPPETFAYSISPQEDPIQSQATVPSIPGQLVATVESGFEYAEVFGIRIQNNHQEIWLRADQKEGSLRRFLIYNPSSKKWDTVSAEIGNRIQIEKLFFTEDGAVYGIPDLNRQDETNEFSVLSKHNEETKTFEFVKPLQKIPATSKDKYRTTQVIFDAQRELFWFLVPDDAIYSFCPETQEVEKHLDIPGEETYDVVKAGISTSGNIYMLSHRGFVYTNIDGIQLTKFDPNTGSIEQFSIPLNPWPVVDDLFVDRSERVWFGAVGWLEPDGTWYQMVPSPIFITNIRFSGLENRWKFPTIELESKDGRLWMKFVNGLVWLDPEKKNWCWFTTKESNIFEDIDGDLWMVADNSLYKLPISD